MKNFHIHVPYNRIRDHLHFIKENRLNLEIYLSAHDLDSIARPELERLLSELDYGPSLSIHAPFMDLCPAAADPKIREATLLRFNQAIDAAEVLTPRVIVFHSGYEKWKYALEINFWLEKSAETWYELLGRADRIGTRIAIENIFEDSPENLIALAERMNTPLFGLCFDTGHFTLFSKVSLNEWISRTAGYIAEFHLHDNDGTRDAHMAPGSGRFDFATLFGLVKGKSNIVHTIEAHSESEVLKSLAALEQY